MDATHPPRPGRHSRRLSQLSRMLLDESTLPPLFPTTSTPPPFLRGHLLRLWTITRELEGRVALTFDSPGGVTSRFGFARGVTGAARCAASSLSHDLVSCGGAPPPDAAAAIAALHEDVFEGVNTWALAVGGRCVYSSRLVALDAGVLAGPAATAAALASGDAAPPPSFLSLRDPSTRMFDLALLYAIRAEAANLRFCPEAIAWIFHQARWAFLPPTLDAMASGNACEEPQGAAAAATATSFFARTTIAPLYAALKAGAVRTRDGVPLASSQRSNYDDLNELFLSPHLLSIAHHNTAPPASTLASVLAPHSGAAPKTFYEHASWSAVLLSHWRWWAVQGVLLHALHAIAVDVVERGGVSIVGVINIDLIQAAIDATTSLQTLVVVQLVAVILAASHALPRMTDCAFPRALCAALSPLAAAKLAYAVVWAGVVVVAAQSKGLLGVDLFGGAVWFAIVGLRVVCFGFAEGACAPCGCTREVRARSILLDLERVCMPGVKSAGGTAYAFGGGTRAPHTFAVAGPGYMRQPLSRVLQYTLFWVFVLLVKSVYDLQVLIEQVHLVATVEAARLSYAPAFMWSFFGAPHALITMGSWASTLSLLLVDSHVAFVLFASVVGCVTLRRDGVRPGRSLVAAFRSGKSGHCRTLAEQFVAVCLPLGGGKSAAHSTDLFRTLSVSECATDLFRRAWDQIILELREGDLISNAEEARLMYGDGTSGVASSAPLFMSAGQVRALLMRMNAVARLACDATVSDDVFHTTTMAGLSCEDALTEVALSLPHVIACVAASHSALGHGDASSARVLLVLQSLFSPPDGVRAALVHMLASPLIGLRARWRTPEDAARELFSSIASLMCAFEHDGASTRLRGSPLIVCTASLLALLGDLVSGQEESDETHHSLPPPPGCTSSIAEPSLDLIARAAMHMHGLTGGGVALPAASGVDAASVAPRMTSLSEIVSALRSMRTLLLTPNEGSGRLDGGGNDALLEDRLESLRECARRTYYLITMERIDAELLVPEATRRLQAFITSLYMKQVPRIASPLHSPSLVVVTPHYAETVLYASDALTTTNAEGISSMVYLKAMHLHEWANFLERLGVTNEAGAWAATSDASGAPVSGVLETRTWASHRGQTLARTVHGLMQAARAMRVLATLQIELEYGAMEGAKASNDPARRSLESIQEDATLAAAWWVRGHFHYVLACQRFAEHGDDDVRRRADLDHLLLLHPLLSISHWEVASSSWSIVLRNAAGIVWRLPAPGQPIIDQIGEGKPENQATATGFGEGRVLQVIDMNQSAELSQLFLLPNALSLILPRGAAARWGGPPPPSVVDPTATALSASSPAPALAPANAPSFPPDDGDVHVGSDGETLSAAYSSASHRPLVVLGLRETIYTHLLSAPALFMAAQEELFGFLWQRLMASPLRVRMHYGHPDLVDARWLEARGGTAKASSVVNVSEDIFMGWTVASRGGESGHAAFLSIGKGRDVGMMQIEVFEGKISGGTAIASTSRDSFRVLAGMDLARQLSFVHSALGYYISQVLILLSLMLALYYITALALTGADAAIQKSGSVYLIGSITALQWGLQLGMLTVIPLAALHTLEHGLWGATTRLCDMLARAAPLFFVFESVTKAHAWDEALAFGVVKYAATGRGFAVGHESFVDIWRSTAHSHMYIGGESLLLCALATAYGSFDSVASYAFFIVPGWVFALSLLFACFWFNPLACETSSISRDWRALTAWLLSSDTSHVSPSNSWRAWFEETAVGPYRHASLTTRIWRTLRVSRLVFLAALLLPQISLTPATASLATMALFALPIATLILLQVLLSMSCMCARGACENAATGILFSVACGIAIVCIFVVPSLLGWCPFTSAPALVVFTCVLHAWACRVAVIWSIKPLALGARGVWCILDALFTGLLLLLQTTLALATPASLFHTRALFSPTYAETLSVIAGGRDVLVDAGAGGRDAAGGARLLHLQALEPLDWRASRRPRGGGGGIVSLRGRGGGGSTEVGVLQNRIGARRFALIPLTQSRATASAAAATAAPATATAVDSMLPSSVEQKDMGGGGFGGLGGIGGLFVSPDASLTPPEPPMQHPLIVATTLPTAIATGGAHPRSLAAIMADATSRATVAAAAVAAAVAAAAPPPPPSTAVGGMQCRGTTTGGRQVPPAAVGRGVGESGGGGGIAALRRRFEGGHK